MLNTSLIFSALCGTSMQEDECKISRGASWVRLCRRDVYPLAYHQMCPNVNICILTLVKAVRQTIENGAKYMVRSPTMGWLASLFLEKPVPSWTLSNFLCSKHTFDVVLSIRFGMLSMLTASPEV